MWPVCLPLNLPARYFQICLSTQNRLKILVVREHSNKPVLWGNQGDIVVAIDSLPNLDRSEVLACAYLHLSTI